MNNTTRLKKGEEWKPGDAAGLNQINRGDQTGDNPEMKTGMIIIVPLITKLIVRADSNMGNHLTGNRTMSHTQGPAGNIFPATEGTTSDHGVNKAKDSMTMAEINGLEEPTATILIG